MRNPNPYPDDCDPEEYPDPEAHRRTLTENIGQYGAKLIQYPSGQTPREYKLIYQNPFEGEIELHFDDSKRAVVCAMVERTPFRGQSIATNNIDISPAQHRRHLNSESNAASPSRTHAMRF